MTAKKPDPMPSAGGSYTRDKQGNLVQTAGPDLHKDDKPKVGTTPAKSGAKPPVKEA
jgi:hypothetical protein